VLRVGRGRKSAKDLPLGVYLVSGRYYVRPVNAEMRQVFAIKFPGKKSAPLGADKEAMRRQWVKLFVADISKDEAPAGTVGELIDRYERDVIALMPEGEPKKKQQRECTSLRDAFGARAYAKSEPEAATGLYLRTMDVQRYLDQEAVREFKDHNENIQKGRPVAANRDVKRLSRIFRLAKTKWGYTEYNPCLQVEYNPEFERDIYHDDDAFMAMYNKASPVMKCLMDLAQMNGARRGMLLRLTLKDADLTNPKGLRLTLNKRRHGRPAKYRYAPWTDELVDVIKAALAHRGTVRGGKKEVADLETAPLFLSRTGKPYGISAFNTEWRRTRDRAKVPAHAFHFHDIKKKALSDSPTLADAQERGDHADPQITQRVYRTKPAVVKPLPRVSGKAS
jgi:integrase